MSLESTSVANERAELAPEFPKQIARCKTFSELLTLLESTSKKHADFSFAWQSAAPGKPIHHRVYNPGEQYTELQKVYVRVLGALQRSSNVKLNAAYLESEAIRVPGYARGLFRAAFAEFIQTNETTPSALLELSNAEQIDARGQLTQVDDWDSFLQLLVQLKKYRSFQFSVVVPDYEKGEVVQRYSTHELHYLLDKIGRAAATMQEPLLELRENVPRKWRRLFVKKYIKNS
jgi:hypothetical protein